MKEIAGAIIVVLGIVAFILFSAGRIDITSKEGWIDWDPATPQSTLDAGDAAANATMVAQQQSAQMTASAAQGQVQAARARAQATAQAAAARATEQAMIADQVHWDQIATRQAEGTVQAVHATTEHEGFVATATSAAEATMAQSTVVAAMATQQVLEDDIAATAASMYAMATRQAIERYEKERDQEHARQVLKECVPIMVFVVIATVLVVVALCLFRQCLKGMPGMMRALLSIWDERTRRKECKTKDTPPLP